MSDRKKDKKFIWFLCITALVGAVNILLNGGFEILLVYVPCMGISISTLYFNYSLCKSGNRWHARKYEQNPGDGEPSKYNLVVSKIAEWALFGIGLVISLVSFA